MILLENHLKKMQSVRLIRLLRATKYYSRNKIYDINIRKCFAQSKFSYY
jgi:hypothetical protein